MALEKPPGVSSALKECSSGLSRITFFDPICKRLEINLQKPHESAGLAHVVVSQADALSPDQIKRQGVQTGSGSTVNSVVTSYISALG